MDTGAGRVAGSVGAAFHPGADANSNAQAAKATSERWDWEITRPRWRPEVGLAGRRATPERSHSDAAKVGRVAEGAQGRAHPHTHHTTPAPLAACSSRTRRSAAERTTSRQRAEGAAERSSNHNRTQR